MVIGFFRYVQKGANVRDLVVRGRAMPSGSRTTVGGLAGSNAGTLHNCRFEGVSSGASIVGGIAGNNLVTGVIESCTTTGSVYGAHFIGGLAGQNHGIIANSTNAASVNTTVEQNDIDLSELTLGDLIGTVYPVYGYLGMAAMLLVAEHAVHARRAGDDCAATGD